MLLNKRRTLAERRWGTERIEGQGVKRSNALPFSVRDIDRILPGGGLAFGPLAPGLAQAGLHLDNANFVEAGSEKNLLTCFEVGLRHVGFSAVVAEVAPPLPLAASCRLQRSAPVPLA